MSFCGILLNVEPDGKRNLASAGRPDEWYPIWKLTVRSEKDPVVLHTACTGRTDIVDRAEKLIGKRVMVLRGGKEGIVGGIREQ